MIIRSRSRAAAFIAGSAAAAFALAGCGGGASPTDGTVSLTLASWGDPFTSATRTHLVEPFMEETGHEVQIVDAPGRYIASLESQNQANNIEWDLLDSTSAPDAYIGYERGLLATMPEDVQSRLLDVLPEDAVTDFGITWSILGYITACAEDAVEACPSNTTELFDVRGFPGSRTSISTSPMVNLSLAEVAAGVPVGELSTHDIDLDRAFSTLEEFQDNSGAWWSSGDQNIQVFENGEAQMGISYSGRAYMVAENGTPMSISWEDGLYNPGFWNVVEGSEHTTEAWEFVEWVASHPENAAAWGDELGYSVPMEEAFDYIDEDTASQLADYPENREQLGDMNFQWYVENYEEVNTRWQEFLRG